ncbi:MAG: hypothetical protein MUP13_09455, partial [Thermoanaerobaculales bacterium]|nr:hypothetical protein [Thermoanaerobaculales bacterium]
TVFVDIQNATSDLTYTPVFALNFVLNSTLYTISAIDGGSESGVASIEYSLDSGAFGLYTVPFNITTHGSHTITYRARLGPRETPPGLDHGRPHAPRRQTRLE